MTLKMSSASLLGTVLLAITSGSVSARTQESATQQDEAAILADLVSRGYVSVDPSTGQLTLDASVLSVLRDYDLVKEVWAPEHAAANCQKSHQCHTPQK